MITDKHKSIFLGIVVSLLVLTIISYNNIYSNEQKVTITGNVMNQLNNEWNNTSQDSEFVGFIVFNGTEIIGYELLGYKNLTSGYNDLVNKDLTYTRATIHSHPKGICALSDIDKSSEEDIVCVMCGENQIKCYNNIK